AEAQSTCGRDGTCNGAGGCRAYGTTIMCAPRSFANSAQLALSFCDGNGRCVTGATSGCAPFTCNGSGAGSACFTSCNTDAQCVPPGQCNANSCGKRTRGSQCTLGTDCLDGFCVEGVCCNNACSEACKSCKVSGQVGTCSNVDHDGVDPKGNCTPPQPDTCGNDGKCNGSGMCRKWNTSTPCRAASCTNNVET